MDEGAMGGQVRNLSLQKRDIILFGNKAKHDFTYPTGRYRTFAAHASQSIYELSQVWKEGYRLSPVWMRGRWADRFVHQLKLSIVENLSLQKRDTIVFNLPVNTVFRRYGDNTVWMILMCV
jgi:hypothetical protein